MAYGALPDRDSMEELGQREVKSVAIGSNRHWLYLRRVFTLITAVVISLAALYIYLDRRIVIQRLDSCGTSSAEALSLGCHFDITSFAWLPQRCFDGELSNQFLALRDWQWFLDSEGLQVVDVSSVLAGKYSQLYVTQEYHMYHCTYMWRKMHRAALTGKVLDGYIGSMMHTEHCEQMLVNRQGSLNETNTMIFTKFVECPASQDGLERAGWYRVVDGVKTRQSFEHLIQ
jgi:hypothetical protein